MERHAPRMMAAKRAALIGATRICLNYRAAPSYSDAQPEWLDGFLAPGLEKSKGDRSSARYSFH